MSLYLKHRPRTLLEVKGNEDTVNSLHNLIADVETCPHVFMFHGPTGCGKTTLARIVAQELGVSDVDYKEIDGVSNSGVDNVREIIRQSVYSPMNGSVRVWVIDEAHELSSKAQQAFLKILEDTPKHVYFILCTTDPQKVIPTVKNRCVQYKVELLNDKQMKKLLHGVIKAEETSLESSVYTQIISTAQGHPRNALQILEKVLSVSENKQLEQAEKYEEEVTESFALCQALLKKSGWNTVRSILEGLKKQDAEGIRRHVMAYASGTLLKSDNVQAGIILEEFVEPFYNSGFPGLTLACYLVVKS